MVKDTLVFFCSDNGPTGPGQAGPLRGHKTTVWEGGHRVPAIAWWPGTIEPGKTDELAMTMDLMPTMLDLAGISPPEDRSLDGVSLSGVLLRGDSLDPRTVFWDWPTRNRSTVRRGPWKLVINQRGAENLPKLFNLKKDRREQNDVSAQHLKRVKRLQKRFDRWQQRVTENVTKQPSQKLKEPKWLR